MLSLSRLVMLLRKKKLNEEMKQEMRLHLDLLTEQNIARGMTPEKASYAARRAFGGVDQIKEQCRDQRTWAWLEQLGRDLRFCARSLRRSLGFTLTVVLTLTLCIGANTTVFSVLYGLILRRLPFRESSQLVEVYNSQIKGGQPKKLTSVGQYLDFKTNADLFEGFALWRDWTFNIGEDSDPYRGVGARVTADLFSLLGLQPVLGRFYTMEECVPGKDHILVLTESYWEKTYGSDPAVIGKVIHLSGELFTIIGVAPKTLEEFSNVAIFFKPFEWTAEVSLPQARLAPAATMYARVKSGVSSSSALAQLHVLESGFLRVAPPGFRDFIDRTGQNVAMGEVRFEQTKGVKTSLLLLQGGALFVLLLGCVNVANLMLARANARQVELAVRQALGASFGALARQLFTESLLLTSVGALLGSLLTWASLNIINIYAINMVREARPIVIHGAVLGFTIAGVFAVAALIALLPIVSTGRTNLLAAMQGGSRAASAGSRVRTVSGCLITLQVTLAVMLLVGAGLLTRSFANVMAVDPGFDAPHIIHGRVAFNASYKDNASSKAAQDLIMTRMREIPGVDSISYSSNRVVDGNFYTTRFPIRGMVLGQSDLYPMGRWLGVSPGFFQTMGIRLIEGRDFNEDDLRSESPRSYIVDRRFAERYFPGRSPVGENFKFGEGNKPEDEPTIVGVVEVAKLGGRDEQDGVPFVYAALGAGWGGFSIEVRTHRPFDQIVAMMRAKLRSIDPTLPLYGVTNLQSDLDNMAANRRGVMALLVGFALIAVILAAVGIYGMLAFDVNRRTREIGIRGAIGATRGQIVSMILRQTLWKVGVGLALGLITAVYLSRFMSSLLFEVKPIDPLSYLSVTAILGIVALFSSWLPARRAAKIDPIIALRSE